MEVAHVVVALRCKVEAPHDAGEATERQTRATGTSRPQEPEKYAKKNPLHAPVCEICGRPRNPELLSVCCFDCESTMGERHDARCDLRTRAEKESRIVPVSQGGRAGVPGS